MQIDSTFIIFSPIRSDKYTIQSYYTYSTSAKKKNAVYRARGRVSWKHLVFSASGLLSVSIVPGYLSGLQNTT